MAAHPFFGSVDPKFDDPFDRAAAPLAARFCLFHPPAERGRGLVLHIHPLAEEMNKSRRMAAMQSRALAAAGFAVLQVDLFGCGDSAGDFGDATWVRWLDDARWAAALLRARSSSPPGTPLWLWGHRVGALLAAPLASELRAHLLLWQPVTHGRTALHQFLRLKAAAQLLDGTGRGVVEGMKRALAEGRQVEVAGYTLHPALAAGLDAAKLVPPAPAEGAQCLAWLEVASGETPELLPASRIVLEKWRASGWQVQAEAVTGPAFWQTAEIEEAPALVGRSMQAVLAAQR